MIKRTFSKIFSKHSLENVVLGLSFVASSFLLTGCYNVPVTLPNGHTTNTKHSIQYSKKYEFRYITSKEDSLEEKSRFTAVISYIGFLKTDKADVSINNVVQNNHAGDGGFIASDGGDAENNTTIYNHGGVFLEVKPITPAEFNKYILQVKSKNNRLSPAIALEEYHKGDTVSIPLLRDVSFLPKRRILYNYSTYKLMNEIDDIYLSEIKKMNK